MFSLLLDLQEILETVKEASKKEKVKMKKGGESDKKKRKKKDESSSESSDSSDDSSSEAEQPAPVKTATKAKPTKVRLFTMKK